MGGSLFPPRLALFVLLLACYLYAIVDLRLVFEARDALFLWNLRFFTDFTGQPGSLMRWADGLLVQWCYEGWPGAIALSSLAWLLLVSTIGFMNATAHARVGGTWLIPGLLLLVLPSDYYVSESLAIGLALAITAANGWARIPAQSFRLRWVCFVATAIVLYYATGTAYYSFLACCVVYEVQAAKRWVPGALLLLAGVGLKFAVDAALAHVNLASRNFHVDFRPVALGTGALLLLCYFPVCAVVVAFRSEVGRTATDFRQRLGKFLSGSSSPKHGKGHKPARPGIPKRAGSSPAPSGLLRWTVGTALVLALAAAAGWYALDSKTKGLLEIEYCFEHQKWSQLLAKARDLQAYSRFTNHDINLALYHTGRLPSEMFSYSQPFGILFDEQQLGPGAMKMLRKPCDLLLEMGRVNEAERLALEMLELCPTGRTLKELAVIKMIKNQPDAAKLFLNVLRDDLVLGRWAEERLQRLAADPELGGDHEIQRIRRLMLAEDDLNATCTIANGDVTVNYGNMFLDLLKHNDRNRMALEVLMAMHLLECNVPAVIELSPFLDHLSYPELPRHYEEAALIYGATHPRQITATPAGLFFRGRKISETAVNNYQRVEAILKSAGGSVERAAPDVARELGDSYFAYYLTHAGKARE